MWVFHTICFQKYKLQNKAFVCHFAWVFQLHVPNETIQMERLTRHLFSRGNLSFKTATVLSNISSLPPRRFKATEATQEKLSDQPISYTKSKAFTFKASQNFRGIYCLMKLTAFILFLYTAKCFMFVCFFFSSRRWTHIRELHLVCSQGLSFHISYLLWYSPWVQRYRRDAWPWSIWNYARTWDSDVGKWSETTRISRD